MFFGMIFKKNSWLPKKKSATHSNRKQPLSSDFKEKFSEIVIFGSWLQLHVAKIKKNSLKILFLSLACSQIWLMFHVDDHQCG
jgi:hypothetical protein